MSPDSKLTFPSHIKTVLITGASGFVGRKLITTDIHRPPTYGIEDEEKLIAVAVDLADKEQVGSLFGYGAVQGVFALQ
jgi:nucleoside-diphosphate-sugar epimerase